MRYWLFVGLAGLLVITAARAASGKQDPVPVSAPQVQQRLAQHQAEVKQLEQAVARQESDSKRASERLQQQDQAIAELQKQLDALHAKPAAGEH